MKYLLWPLVRVVALLLLTVLSISGFFRVALRALAGANQIPPSPLGLFLQSILSPVFLPIMVIYLISSRLYLEVMVVDVKLGFAKSEEGLRVAAQTFPGDYRYWYMRFFRTEAREEATAGEAEDPSPEVEVSKAEKHFRTGAQLWEDGRLNEAVVEFNEAIAEYSKAIIVDPLMLAAAYHERGRAYLHLGQPQQAIKDLDEGLRLLPQRLSPERAAFYLNRGAAYNALGQAERALHDFDEAIRLDPRDAMAYYNRGASYNALNQFQRALQDFDKAIQLDPHFPLAYSSRGVVYDNLGQYQRAIDDYGNAIRLNRELAVAYVNRAFVYTRLNKDSEAERDMDWATALGYDPTVLRREIEEIRKQR